MIDQESFTPSSKPQDDLDEIMAMQARQSAQRLVSSESHPQQPASPTADRQPVSPRVRRNRLIAGGVATAVAAGVTIGVTAEALAQPDFSEETKTYTVENGDGLYDAAEDIVGINSIDIRDAVDHISVDPANIDALNDGLQPGEQITIPVSVEGHESEE